MKFSDSTNPAPSNCGICEICHCTAQTRQPSTFYMPKKFQKIVGYHRVNFVKTIAVSASREQRNYAHTEATEEIQCQSL